MVARGKRLLPPVRCSSSVIFGFLHPRGQERYPPFVDSCVLWTITIIHPSVDFLFHDYSRCGVFFAGAGDEFSAATGVEIYRCEGGCLKGLSGLAVFVEAGDDAEAVEAGECFGGEGEAEFAGECSCIGVADSE